MSGEHVGRQDILFFFLGVGHVPSSVDMAWAGFDDKSLTIPSCCHCPAAFHAVEPENWEYQWLFRIDGFDD